MDWKNRKVQFRGSARMLIATLLLLLVAACEHVPSPAAPDVIAPERTGRAAQTAQRHQLQAFEARDQGQYGECASSFAEAARLTLPESSQRWFEASRCAARAGDYRQSTFFLNAAASDGYAQLTRIQNEPLFRPLHSGKRWLLILDQVTANANANPSLAAPLEHDGPSGIPCALLRSLRDQLLLRS